MAIHGSIEEAGLPNVLQVLALGGKTGSIAVERATVHGAIYLDRGMVIWAEIVSSGDRLGDHLVRSGKITREQLRHAIETLIQDPAHTLADVLVNADSISRGELDRFVQHQVEEAIYLMCSWTKGQFRYEPGTTPPRHAINVSLHAERLLLEAGRRADEWTVIEIAIPSYDAVYRRLAPRAGAPALEFTSDQHRILPLLDGTRDVNGLIELSGLSAFEVGKALLDLITWRAVTLQERRSNARHFEEDELSDYALKAGEFVDPEHRRDAARHIADCQLCGTRLRRLQVRRTQEMQTVKTVETVETVKPAGYQVTDVKPPAAPPEPQLLPPVAKPPVAKPPGAKPPEPSRPARPSSDLVWLMSPEEADQVRRSEQRAALPEQKRPTPPPAPPPPAPPPPAPTPPPVPRISRRAEEKPAAPPPPVRRRVPSGAVALGVAGLVLTGGVYIAQRAAAPQPRVPTVASRTVNPPPPITAPPVVRPPVAAPETIRSTPPPKSARDSTPVLPALPDAELNAGGWRITNRAEAISVLGGKLAAIPGLRIESFSTSEARSRTRVRIAQLTRANERIVLIESAGSDVPDSGPARATAVSVMPPPDPTGESIGSASLGNIQITARSSLGADALTTLLRRLTFIRS